MVDTKEGTLVEAGIVAETWSETTLAAMMKRREGEDEANEAATFME